MHRLSWASKLIGMVLGILLLSGAILVAAQMINQPEQTQMIPPPLPTVLTTPSPTRPLYCVPIPRKTITSWTMTPTPDRFSSPVPDFRPVVTVTPRVYAHIVDLSPELPRKDKGNITVFRCNGTFDLFIAGPEINIDQSIKLEPGDVILSASPPASMMGQEPPEPLKTPTTIPTTTTTPYPPPGNP